MVKLKEVLHKKFKLSVHDSGAYYEVYIYSDVIFEIQDRKDFVKAQVELGAKVLPVLITIGQHATTTIDFLRYTSKKVNDPYTKAEAFVTRFMAARILINFYLKIIKPERPSKLFDSNEKAIAWIKCLK